VCISGLDWDRVEFGLSDVRVFRHSGVCGGRRREKQAQREIEWGVTEGQELRHLITTPGLVRQIGYCIGSSSLCSFVVSADSRISKMRGMSGEKMRTGILITKNTLGVLLALSSFGWGFGTWSSWGQQALNGTSRCPCASSSGDQPARSCNRADAMTTPIPQCPLGHSRNTIPKLILSSFIITKNNTDTYSHPNLSLSGCTAL